MDQRPTASIPDSMVWECSLCQYSKERPKPVVYENQNYFKDHYDRTCHICFSEFTNKTTKDRHQLRHSDGISSECKSLCSLCGKTFKVCPNGINCCNNLNL